MSGHTPWVVIASPTDAEMYAVQGVYLVADDLPIEDARLIAAAPDLLAAHLAWEAAEDARNDCTDYSNGCDNEGPWEQCPLCSVRFGEAIDLRHAAIAKATGQ